MDNNNKQVKAKVKTFVDYLLNEYEYSYFFTEKDFEDVNLKNFRRKDFKWPVNPIIFSSGKEDDEIRILAYGGCIGTISMKDSNRFLDVNEIIDFIKCLSDGKTPYKDKHNNNYWLPNKFKINYSKYIKNNNIEEKNDEKFEIIVANDIVNNCPSPETLTTNNKKDLKYYLDLLICAAYIRFMHRSKQKMIDISERSMQSIIARINLNNQWYQNIVCVDVEFKTVIKKINNDNTEKNKTPSVDFVVIDKQDKSFGLIEFKYQGKSLDKNKKNKNKDDNSLAEHCSDFRIMLSDEYREKIVNKLIKHTKLLIELDIIKDAKVKKIIDDININNLWCGFYFVEDKERSTKRNNKFMNLGDRIVFDCYNQIICNKEFDKQFLQDIKFQNSDTCDVVFNMTEKMYYSCKQTISPYLV